MSPKLTDMRDKVVMAALEFSAAGQWRQITMPEIATAAGISSAELYRLFPMKSDILAGFLEKIDRQVLAQEFEFEDEDTPRDRLFEVLMSRFDALAPHRVSIRTLSRELIADPLSTLSLGPAAMISTTWMLAAAGISSYGPFGLFRVKGLLAVWLATLRVWLAEENPDLPRTMAALDRYLRRAERGAIAMEGFEASALKFGDLESAGAANTYRE